MNHTSLRWAVLEAARGMNARGLNRGRSGNVSARVPEGMLLTPSALPYESLEPAGLVIVGLDGAVVEAGAGPPSTEWHLHAAILEGRPDVGAVLHAHPIHATALACLHREIPAFHYMVALAGGDAIRCAPYATFGTPELAAHALAALEGRRACLLANHGIVTVGESPAEALELAVEVETLASQYLAALQVAPPVLLTPEQMAEVHDRFGDYGRDRGRGERKPKLPPPDSPVTP
jgi:L-fuculose-phosphate aldolase